MVVTEDSDPSEMEAIVMLTLEHSKRLCDDAMAEGQRLGLAPLAVVVLDVGGNILASQRDERAGILRHDIAVAKAWGSLGMGFGSRELAARAEKNPAFITALNGVASGRLAPSPGGALLRRKDGTICGAMGVSGDICKRRSNNPSVRQPNPLVAPE